MGVYSYRKYLILWRKQSTIDYLLRLTYKKYILIEKRLSLNKNEHLFIWALVIC